MVSCDGMPLAKSRKLANRSYFLWPYSSTSTQESAPATTAQMVRAMMSDNLCHRPCSRRGSGNSSKRANSERAAVRDMLLLLHEGPNGTPRRIIRAVQLSQSGGTPIMLQIAVVRLPWMETRHVLLSENGLRNATG